MRRSTTILAACLAATALPASAAPAQSRAPLLTGSWMVVEIDGTRPLLEAEPRLSFGRVEFSGGTGCNAIQGRFVIRNGRFSPDRVTQTERACGPPLAQQERRVIRLLEGAPRIVRLERGEIALADRRGRLRLVRMSSRPIPPLR